MSTDDPATRQSSEWTASEVEESEGMQTDMTSIVESEEADGQDYEDDGRSVFLGGRGQSGYRPDSETMMVGDQAASTRSLWVPELDYREENGRRYCKDYFMPNDELECARQTLLHQVHMHVFDGQPTTVSLQNPEKILDIGTGVGEWAIKVGEIFPECEVIGTDISAIQETSVPHNVFFEIDDAEDDWERAQDSFDLVHLRHMDGSFRDWSHIYRQAFDCLKPGGYIEVKDYEDFDESGLQSMFHPGSDFERLLADAVRAAEITGRPWGSAHLDPTLLLDAGFVDVHVTDHIVSVTTETGKVGKLWLISSLDALEATCLRLLTTHMGWDPDHAKRVCEQAAREFVSIARDPVKSKGTCFKIKVLTGRKPADSDSMSLYSRRNSTVSVDEAEAEADAEAHHFFTTGQVLHTLKSKHSEDDTVMLDPKFKFRLASGQSLTDSTETDTATNASRESRLGSIATKSNEDSLRDAASPRPTSDEVPQVPQVLMNSLEPRIGDAAGKETEKPVADAPSRDVDVSMTEDDAATDANFSHHADITMDGTQHVPDATPDRVVLTSTSHA